MPSTLMSSKRCQEPGEKILMTPSFRLISLTSNISGDAYSSFSLLLESTLAEDVGKVEKDLNLVRKLVKVSVLPCGQIHLSQEEVHNSDPWSKQSVFSSFFLMVYLESYLLDLSHREQREIFWLQTDTSSIWHTSFMFLLLPVETKNLASSATIDWSAINSCASIVEFLKKNSPLELRVSDGNQCNTSSGQEVLLDDKTEETNLIHFANASSEKIVWKNLFWDNNKRNIIRKTISLRKRRLKKALMEIV